MQKSLYSLILNDEVVNKVDELASEQNTNRSNMINQILAEYVSYVTPEKRINNIFNYVNDLLNSSIFSSYIEPHDTIMSVKSSLDYKYRPTIKYSVELFRTEEDAIGELKVIFRTQSMDLLYKLAQFYKLWTRMESVYLRNYYTDGALKYDFDNGKFERNFIIPNGKNYSNEQIAKGISDYIKMFDDIVKGYLSDKYKTVTDIENKYLAYLNNGMIII